MPDEPIDRDPESGASEGLSRRKMLGRIGLVTAVAWTTPIVTSLRTPAFAQAVSQGACTCFEGCGNTDACNPSDCFCISSLEGQKFCSQNFFCVDARACVSTDDCPNGWVCQGGECPGNCGNVCVPPCGTCLTSGLAPHHGATNRG